MRFLRKPWAGSTNRSNRLRPRSLKVAVRNEYTETVRDLQELLKKEADEQRRENLGNDLKKMAQDLEKQKENVVEVRVLSERVDNLKSLVWVLIFGLAATIFTLVLELVKK